VFLERTTKEQHADTFGGIAAPQDGVAAIENGDDAARDLVEAVVGVAYGPVLDVHWVTVKRLAVLEPTLVETVAWMIGGLLKEALHETVHTVGARTGSKGNAFRTRSGRAGEHPARLEPVLRRLPDRDGLRPRTIVRDDWKDLRLQRTRQGHHADAAYRPDRTRAGVTGRRGETVNDHCGTVRATDIQSGHQQTLDRRCLALRLKGGPHRLVLAGRPPALRAWRPSVGGRWDASQPGPRSPPTTPGDVGRVSRHGPHITSRSTITIETLDVDIAHYRILAMRCCRDRSAAAARRTLHQADGGPVLARPGLHIPSV
jgi:Phosphogluconate dehydrogenase (decarboxylating) C-term